MEERHLREDLLKRFVMYALALFVIFVLIINGFFVSSSINFSMNTNERLVEVIQSQLENSLIPSRTEIKSKYSLHLQTNFDCEEDNLNFISELEVLSHDGTVLYSICGDTNHEGFDMSTLPLVEKIANSEIGKFVYGTTNVDTKTGEVYTGFGFKTVDHIVMAHVGLSDFKEFISNENESQTVVVIVDEFGSYIYNDDEEKVKQRAVDPNYLNIRNGRIKNGDAVRYNGKNHYVYISHIEDTNWSVIIYQDQSFITSSVIQISALIIIMIFILIMMLTLNINEVLKKVEHNLNTFSGAVMSVSDGKYEPISYDNQYEEFKMVSIKMNEMISQIDERENEINMLNDSLELSYLNTLTVLAKAIEAKDKYTGSHCDRVSYYSQIIGEKIGLSETDLYQLKYGSLLHDIGKISIAESILSKPAKLTEDEFKEIINHPSNGHLIVRDLPNFTRAKEIVLYHHERYDGTGYPSGLKGDEIPLMARIVGVADAFDAMTSDRIYRKGIKMNSEAFEELRRCSGSQFDPYIVEEFIEVMTQIEQK